MREVPKSGPLVLKGGGGSADPPDPPWLRAWSITYQPTDLTALYLMKCIKV